MTQRGSSLSSVAVRGRQEEGLAVVDTGKAEVFDPPSPSQLWAGDGRPDLLYEEINIITKGGDYSWNLREGLRPFGARGSAPGPS